jgi:formate dehydrogenase subunit gamma
MMSPEASRADRTPAPEGEDRLQRYDFYERVVHWLAALSFLYAAFTGLALWSPRLFWLAAVFGGGETVRGWHPWSGVVFAVVMGLMFSRWARAMRLDAGDRRWLREVRRYATNDEAGLPEAGRFNAGQKVLFWAQAASTLLLFASGLALWFPEAAPRALRLAAILVHAVTAALSMALIVLHVYMGTAAVPGSFRAMTRGWVTRKWAEEHHARWSRGGREGGEPRGP